MPRPRVAESWGRSSPQPPSTVSSTAFVALPRELEGLTFFSSSRKVSLRSAPLCVSPAPSALGARSRWWAAPLGQGRRSRAAPLPAQPGPGGSDPTTSPPRAFARRAPCRSERGGLSPGRFLPASRPDPNPAGPPRAVTPRVLGEGRRWPLMVGDVWGEGEKGGCGRRLVPFPRSQYVPCRPEALRCRALHLHITAPSLRVLGN